MLRRVKVNNEATQVSFLVTGERFDVEANAKARAEGLREATFEPVLGYHEGFAFNR